MNAGSRGMWRAKAKDQANGKTNQSKANIQTQNMDPRIPPKKSVCTVHPQFCWPPKNKRVGGVIIETLCQFFSDKGSGKHVKRTRSICKQWPEGHMKTWCALSSCCLPSAFWAPPNLWAGRSSDWPEDVYCDVCVHVAQRYTTTLSMNII